MNAENKFVPGPWEVLGDQAGAVEIVGKGGLSVAELWINEYTKANASLTASAPDLFVMLEIARDIIVDLIDEGDYERTLADIDSALAKARGKQS